MSKNGIFKKIIYWLIMAGIVAFFVLYNTLGWSTQCINISKYLDAGIKSIVVIALVGGLSKIISFVLTNINTKNKRSQTVSRLLNSLIKYVLAIIAIVLVITFFIEDTSSLFTGLSMLTLVVGLGAQTLISDVVAGIFIVFEGSYQVGDVVVIDGWRGIVNEIGIRTTKIEDAGGNVQIINNSQISRIINNSSKLSVAICEVGIEYGESIERVENIIQAGLEHIKQRIPAIEEGPFYLGITSLADSAVVLKISAKCKEDSKFQIQRDLNREIKILFDKNGVGIPFPQLTISKLVENDKEATKTEARKAQNFVDAQKELSKGFDDVNK